MEDNPVYRYLTRNLPQPSRRKARLLQALIGILGGCGAIGVVYYMNTSRESFVAYALLIMLGLSSVGFTFITPSLALLIAASFTAKHTSQKNLAVLWLTNISPQQLINGFIGTVTYRLRLLRVIVIALVPQMVIVVAYFMHSRVGILDCLGPGGCDPDAILFYLLDGLLPAILVAGTLVGMGIVLFRLATATGVWAGFRWREKAPIAAGSILLVAWMTLIVLVLLSIIGLVFEACIIAGVFIVLPILWYLTWLVQGDTYRVVEKTRQMQ